MKKNAGAIFIGFFIIVFISSGIGFFGGLLGAKLFSTSQDARDFVKSVTEQDVKVVREESAIITVAENSKDSVVSVIISTEVPIYEQLDPFDFWGMGMSNRTQVGTELQQVGAGTGFIVSKDGMIITNRHVVSDVGASYTVILNNGEKYDATVLAKDTLLDIAFLKIDAPDLKPLPLGTSKDLKVGQSVVAIGNALGEFSNTVSSGIISGMGRSIVASNDDGSNSELLTNVIQTDASINRGNSGGPLLDIEGNVIGVNVAVAQSAENIGFAIPIDDVIDLMSRLNDDGSIDRPRLGVRVAMIDDAVQKENDLPYNYGAVVVKGTKPSQLAVLPGSPADKAGIEENDIILKVDGKKLTTDNPLPNVIQTYKFGDTVTLLISRDGKEIEIKVKLEKF